MAKSRSRKLRWLVVSIAILALLIGGGIVGFRVATEQLKGKVASALGPGSEMAELLGVSIRGVAGTLEFLGRKSLEGVGEAAGAVGSALKGIFGGGEKP